MVSRPQRLESERSFALRTRTQRALVILLTATVLIAAKKENFVFTVLDQATVQETPAYFSKILATIPEGTKLRLTEIEEGWAEVVLDSGESGYIRENAVRDKKANRKWNKILGAPRSERDTYAAQKGFGPSVEEEYRNPKKKKRKDRDKPPLDYTPVEHMLIHPSYPEPMGDLEDFRSEGKLGEFQGGPQK